MSEGCGCGYTPDGPVATKVRAITPEAATPYFQAVHMLLAREIDKINQRLDDHADPDLVGPHYRGDES